LCSKPKPPQALKQQKQLHFLQQWNPKRLQVPQINNITWYKPRGNTISISNSYSSLRKRTLRTAVRSCGITIGGSKPGSAISSTYDSCRTSTCRTATRSSGSGIAITDGYPGSALSSTYGSFRTSTLGTATRSSSSSIAITDGHPGSTISSTYGSVRDSTHRTAISCSGITVIINPRSDRIITSVPCGQLGGISGKGSPEP
jgi:hypothetical protein